MFSKISYKFLFIMLIIYLPMFASYSYAHWADNTLIDFQTKGFVTDVDSFSLNDTVSVGAMTAIVNKYYSFEDTFYNYETSFTIAVDKGYIQNHLVNEFITREDFAVVLCKLIKIDKELELLNKKILYSDNDFINAWTIPYVFKLSDLGIMIGYPDGSFKPQNLLTYAELITSLSRIRGEGGGDFELVDEDIEKVTLKLTRYSSGEIYVEDISSVLNMNVGDAVEIAVMLPDSVNEDEIEYHIADESIATFDKDFNLLNALKEGNTQMQVLYEGEVQQEFEINTIKKEEQ